MLYLCVFAIWLLACSPVAASDDVETSESYTTFVERNKQKSGNLLERLKRATKSHQTTLDSIEVQKPETDEALAIIGKACEQSRTSSYIPETPSCSHSSGESDSAETSISETSDGERFRKITEAFTESNADTESQSTIAEESKVVTNEITEIINTCTKGDEAEGITEAGKTAPVSDNTVTVADPEIGVEPELTPEPVVAESVDGTDATPEIGCGTKLLNTCVAAIKGVGDICASICLGDDVFTREESTLTEGIEEENEAIKNHGQTIRNANPMNVIGGSLQYRVAELSQQLLDLDESDSYYPAHKTYIEDELSETFNEINKNFKYDTEVDAALHKLKIANKNLQDQQTCYEQSCCLPRTCWDCPEKTDWCCIDDTVKPPKSDDSKEKDVNAKQSQEENPMWPVWNPEQEKKKKCVNAIKFFKKLYNHCTCKDKPKTFATFLGCVGIYQCGKCVGKCAKSCFNKISSNLQAAGSCFYKFITFNCSEYYKKKQEEEKKFPELELSDVHLEYSTVTSEEEENAQKLKLANTAAETKPTEKVQGTDKNNGETNITEKLKEPAKKPEKGTPASPDAPEKPEEKNTDSEDKEIYSALSDFRRRRLMQRLDHK